MGKKFIDLDFSGRGVDRISKWEAELPNGIRIRTTNDTMEDHLAALSAVEVASKYLAAREIVPTYTAPKKRLDEAAKEFLASIEVGEPNAKTLGQKKLSVNGFTKWKGPATDIATLVPKDFQDFSVYLKNVEELALPTISNRLIYIRQWMAWAQTMRYYPSGENPANGVAIYGKKSKNERAKKNGWQAFSDDQIQQLFNPQNIAEKCPKPLSTRWCMVLSLYTGARISELAQLALADISEKDGTLWITVDSLEVGQSVKTDASRRTIPLHSDIKALGLMERIAALKKSGATMLFPDLKPGQNGYGGAPSKGITRYLKALGIKARGAGKIGAHSFRNCIIQHFDAVGVSDSASRLYTGHRVELDAHETNYKTETVIQRTDLLAVLKHLPKPEWGINIQQIKPLLHSGAIC